MTTYSTDPALYLFTTLTAGSSHIVTATSRLETILRANRVPFKCVDVATDEKARMLWGRRAQKDQAGRVRKLPGLVQEGIVLGDLVEVEDWNEYGELKQHVKIHYDEHTIPSIHDKPPEPPKPKLQSKPKAAPAPPAAPAAPMPGEAKSAAPKDIKPAAPAVASAVATTTLPIRSVADEAARKAKELRLKSLREKVHGESKQADVTKSGAGADDASKAATRSTASADVPVHPQSPSSSTWKGQAASDSARDMAQSPTSSRWRPSSVDAKSPSIPAAVGGARPAEAKSESKESAEQEAQADRAAGPAQGTKADSPKQEKKSTAA